MSCVIPFNYPNPGLTPSRSIPPSREKSKRCVCVCVRGVRCVWFCWLCFDSVWFSVWFCVWFCLALRLSSTFRGKTTVGRYPSPSSTLKTQIDSSISVSLRMVTVVPSIGSRVPVLDFAQTFGTLLLQNRKCNLFSIRREGALWDILRKVALVICSHAFESAYRYRLFFYADPSAGRLAWSITCASKDTREYI